MGILLTIVVAVVSGMIVELLKRLLGFDIVQIAWAPVERRLQRSRARKESDENAKRYMEMVEERKRLEAAEKHSELAAPEQRKQLPKPKS